MVLRGHTYRLSSLPLKLLYMFIIRHAEFTNTVLTIITLLYKQPTQYIHVSTYLCEVLRLWSWHHPDLSLVDNVVTGIHRFPWHHHYIIGRLLQFHICRYNVHVYTCTSQAFKSTKLLDNQFICSIETQPVGAGGGEGAVEKVTWSDHTPCPLSEVAAIFSVYLVSGWSLARRWVTPLPRNTSWNLPSERIST